jgi:hypothetical protein
MVIPGFVAGAKIGSAGCSACVAEDFGLAGIFFFAAAFRLGFLAVSFFFGMASSSPPV